MAIVDRSRRTPNRAIVAMEEACAAVVSVFIGVWVGRGGRAGPGRVRRLDRGGERHACGCRGLRRRLLRPRIGVGPTLT